MELEKSVLGQNGVEFRDNFIKILKRCETQELRTLYALYLFATEKIENSWISLKICIIFPMWFWPGWEHILHILHEQCFCLKIWASISFQPLFTVIQLWWTCIIKTKIFLEHKIIYSLVNIFYPTIIKRSQTAINKSWYY